MIIFSYISYGDFIPTSILRQVYNNLRAIKVLLKRELIYIDRKDETDRIERYTQNRERCTIVFKNSNREFSYSRKRAKIVQTAVSSDVAYNVFSYLKEIANSVGLKTDKGSNILSNSYNSISRIPNDCILSCFLNST